MTSVWSLVLLWRGTTLLTIGWNPIQMSDTVLASSVSPNVLVSSSCHIAIPSPRLIEFTMKMIKTFFSQNLCQDMNLIISLLIMLYIFQLILYRKISTWAINRLSWSGRSKIPLLKRLKHHEKQCKFEKVFGVFGRCLPEELSNMRCFFNHNLFENPSLLP